jgi:hypothetical protein
LTDIESIKEQGGLSARGSLAVIKLRLLLPVSGMKVGGPERCVRGLLRVPDSKTRATGLRGPLQKRNFWLAFREAHPQIALTAFRPTAKLAPAKVAPINSRSNCSFDGSCDSQTTTGQHIRRSDTPPSQDISLSGAGALSALSSSRSSAAPGCPRLHDARDVRAPGFQRITLKPGQDCA